MRIYRCRYFREGKPQGRSYFFKSEEEFRPGELVVSSLDKPLMVIDVDTESDYPLNKLDMIFRCED